jgi:hypothetical protein
VKLSVKTAIALAVLATAVTAAGTAGGQGVDETCMLALTKSDPATANVAYPDESAIYWVGGYQQVPGTRLRIQGEFPHARYMSFNVYDQAQRPIDAIADEEVVPDHGSRNPFLPRAKRNAKRRSYTLFVDFGPRPESTADRARNTLYTGTGQSGAPNVNGALIYRVYIPDRGRDETGGAGIPTVTIEAVDGGPAPQSACAGVAKPPGAGVNEQFAASDAELPLPGRPAADPPAWRKFVNLLYTASPSEATQELGGTGGFFSNVHNAYLATSVSREHGKVLVTRMRAPTFPDTRDGAKRMRRADLRYFSMCENEFASQRFIACRADDQTVVDRRGFATYVMSTPAERPTTATRKCGVTWLPWGPFRTGLLIYRHMLPAAGFEESIQGAEVEREAETMGDYYPVSRYYADADAYDRDAGC